MPVLLAAEKTREEFWGFGTEVKVLWYLLAAASGSVALDPRPVSVAELVSAGLRSASPRADAGGVALAAEHAPDLTLQADPGRLAQVLDNLLSNAIKYSPAGGTVTVRAWVEPGSAFRPRTAFLQVQDTGMGMDDDDQRELFTKFFRTGAVRRAGIPGAGLGLAITKNIVEAHGGTISLVSAPGTGSTFTVSLPQPPQPEPFPSVAEPCTEPHPGTAAESSAADVEIAETVSSLE